ncbi:hypothetical protein LCM4577_23640 [Mesorhizobium sp. LCM 4577]|nr:hypothetical protein LCM4576_25945 [Mesorhizobium sp. LCM 4576]OHV69067.1 hypothetical protein LCM4577_23640 [Mesorhizobium sp. LCM 4577]
MARQRRGIWSLRFAWKAILSQFGVHYPFGKDLLQIVRQALLSKQILRTVAPQAVGHPSKGCAKQFKLWIRRQMTF